MSVPADDRPVAGVATFVLLVIALSCPCVALVHHGQSRSLIDAASRYFLVVGWEPLAAYYLVHRFIDRRALGGLDAMPAKLFRTAIALPVALIAVAGFIDFAVVGPIDEPPHATIVMFAITVPILWGQSLAGELAWRGYLLPRLVREVGTCSGLVVHAAMWALCQAPLFFVAGLPEARFAGFVTTCTLLGLISGCLRIASGAIWAGVTFGAILTIAAGPPFLMPHALRGAIYQPAGWLPLSIGVVAIMARRRATREADDE